MTSDTAMLSALLHGSVLADQLELLKQHVSMHSSFSHSQLRGSSSASCPAESLAADLRSAAGPGPQPGTGRLAGAGGARLTQGSCTRGY
eukprot:2136238-Rhodomonas_salina.1